MIFLNKQFVALFCLQALLARSDGCFYTPMRCRRQVQSFSKTPSDIGSHHRRSQENVGITLNGSNMSVRSVALRWNPIIWAYLQQFAKHGGSCGKWRLAQQQLSLKRVESVQKMDRTVQRESRQSLSTAHALLEKCMERRFLKEQIKLVMRDECLMLNSLYCVYIYWSLCPIYLLLYCNCCV